MVRTFARAQADLQKELALEGDRDARLRKIYGDVHGEIRRLREERADTKMHALQRYMYLLNHFYRHDKRSSVRKDDQMRLAYAQILVSVRDDVFLREQVARIIEYLEFEFERECDASCGTFSDGMVDLDNVDMRRKPVETHAYSYLLAVLIRLDLRADDVIACRVDGPDTLGLLRDVLVGAPPAHACVATIAACFRSMARGAALVKAGCARDYTAHGLAAQATIQRACYVLSLRPIHAYGDAFSTHVDAQIVRDLTMLQPMGCSFLFRPTYAIVALMGKFDASNHLLLALLLAERREEATPIDGVATTRMPSGAMLTEVILGSIMATRISEEVPEVNRCEISSFCRGLVQHPLLLAALPTTYSVFNSTIANALSAMSIDRPESTRGYAYDSVIGVTMLPQFHRRLLMSNNHFLFAPPWSPVGVPRCAWTDVPFVRDCMPFAGAHDAIYKREAERRQEDTNTTVTSVVLTPPREQGRIACHIVNRMCAAADATWLTLSPYTPHWMTQSIEALHAGWAADAGITPDAAIAQMYVHGKHTRPTGKRVYVRSPLTELAARITFELSLAQSPPSSLMSAMYDIFVRAQSLASEIQQIVRAAPQLDPGRLIDMSVGAWSTSDMYRYVHGGKLDALRAAYAATTHARAQAQAQAHAHAAVPIDATMSVA